MSVRKTRKKPRPISAETRRKMSEAAKRRNQDPEYRAKVAEGLKRHYADPKQRKKMSRAVKKHYEDPKARLKHSKALLEFYKDPEMRKKLSESLKRYYADDEARKKISDGLKLYYAEEAKSSKTAQESGLPAREIIKRLPPNIKTGIVNGQAVVFCKTCNEPFPPSVYDIRSARYYYEQGGGKYLYCSIACKHVCPIYGFQSKAIDPRSKLMQPKTEREIARSCQTNHLKQLQCDEVGHNYCEKCGDIIDVDLHHTLTVAKTGREAINSAGHMLLCVGCHTELHSDCKS